MPIGASIGNSIRSPFEEAGVIPKQTSERHRNERLTNTQVEEIVKLRKKGLTHSKIAKMFNVPRRRIGNILSGNRRVNQKFGVKDGK